MREINGSNSKGRRLLFLLLVFTQQGDSFQPTSFLPCKNDFHSTKIPSYNRQELYMSSPSGQRQPTENFKDSATLVKDSPKTFLNGFFGNNIHEDGKENDDENYVMKDMAKYLNQAEEDVMEIIIAENEREEENLGPPILPIAGSFLLVILALLSQNPSVVQTAQSFFADPTSSFQSVVDNIASMGDMGLVYFAAVYTVAEVLAIPAIPLTASAGYLFGVRDGTAIVLLSGSIAAGIGFLIGRTLLREKVEEILKDYPKFQAIDRVIGKEGFKLMVLLRLAPIFPFSLSNYLYGVTSVKFWPYFWGTVIGFAPGTLAYVYTGTVGKALTLPGGNAEPWYVYVGILAAFVVVLKVVADVATDIIDSFDEESA